MNRIFTTLLILFCIFSVVSCSSSKKTSHKKRSTRTAHVKKNELNFDTYKNDIDKLNLVDPSLKKVISFKTLLQQHKGNVVYVDLWASWCMPCIALLPSTYRLKQELKDENIDIIYLSIDREIEKWNQSSKKEKIPSKNSYYILNKDTSERFLSWFVLSLPRYLIFDKNGNLIDDEAAKPTNTDLKNHLLDLSN